MEMVHPQQEEVRPEGEKSTDLGVRAEGRHVFREGGEEDGVWKV